MAAAALLLWCVWLIGQGLRERTWLTGVCFFVPSPFIALVLLAVAVRIRRAHRLAARWILTLALLPVVWVAAVENQWRSPADATGQEPVLRIVHWNIWYATLGWERIERELHLCNADFYAFSELPEDADLAGVAQRLGPEFTILRQSSMAVIARGRLSAGSDVPFVESQGRGMLLEWASPQGRLRVLIADLPSSIRIPRGPVLRELWRHIDSLQPDLVLGDLNVPRRSATLSNLPAGYVHAYDAAGSGWSYTWPVGCPLWAIDQCLAGRRIQPLVYRLQSTTASDHRLQQLDCTILTDQTRL